MLPLAQIMENYNISYHDDKQIYITVSPYDCSPLQLLSECIQQVNQRMGQHFLQLKLEILLSTCCGFKPEL